MGRGWRESAGGGGKAVGGELVPGGGTAQGAESGGPGGDTGRGHLVTAPSLVPGRPAEARTVILPKAEPRPKPPVLTSLCEEWDTKPAQRATLVYRTASR